MSGGGFDPGSLIGDLVETLRELVIDEVTIDGILDSLAQAETDMPGRAEIRRLGGSAFGNLPKGVELSTHTSNADEFVMDAMVEMLTTLGVYVDGVKSFREGAAVADEFSAAQLLRINAAVTYGQDVNERQEEDR
jgi:hypothetical protein